MAYPQWYPIDCNARLPADVICYEGEDPDLKIRLFVAAHSNWSIKRAYIECSNGYILFEQNCYHFNKNSSNIKTYFRDESDISHILQNMVLICISKVSMGDIVFGVHSNNNNNNNDNNKNRLVHVKYDVLTETLQQIEIENAGKHQNTFQMGIEKKTNIIFDIKRKQRQVGSCKSGEFISMSLFQNNRVDCSGGHDDEVPVGCVIHENIMNGSICEISCLKQTCNCPDLYYKNRQRKCSPFREKHIHVRHSFDAVDTLLKGLETSLTKVLKTEMDSDLCSFYTDCTFQELQQMELSYINFRLACSNADEILCTYGCSRCFPIAKVCVYELDHCGNLMHCPSGAHLKNCQKIECNNMFKCNEHYCVPYRFVLE